MRPLEISLDNCNELLTDARRRILASEARKFADCGHPPRSRWRRPADYFAGILKLHEELFWLDAYRRRRARIARQLNSAGLTHKI